MTAIRKTVGICFWLLKVGVIILIMFSVMTFLSEIAHRMRMRLPQPFKGVAVIAMAITTTLPFAKAVDGIKYKALGRGRGALRTRRSGGALRAGSRGRGA